MVVAQENGREDLDGMGMAQAWMDGHGVSAGGGYVKELDPFIWFQGRRQAKPNSYGMNADLHSLLYMFPEFVIFMFFVVCSDV